MQTLTLRNTNSYAMTYSLSASTAQGLTTYSSSAAASVLPATSPPSIPSTSARVVFSLRTITVPAGQTATVTATFTAPRLAQSQIAKFPFYSGYVEVTGRPVYSPGKAVEVLSVPYFGLAAKMSDLPGVFSCLPFLALPRFRSRSRGRTLTEVSVCSTRYDSDSVRRYQVSFRRDGRKLPDGAGELVSFLERV